MTLNIFILILIFLIGTIIILSSIYLKNIITKSIKTKLIFDEIKSIYLIISIIMLIRIFVIEPFRIPSGSMNPTLISGDIIFVNKFIYGIKNPILNKNILNINYPKKGDIIVFMHTNGQYYIKRIIGIPGDYIKYENKKIYINKQTIKTKYIGKYIKIDNGITLEIDKFKEYLIPSKEHRILKINNINTNKYNYCDITVPKNSYFVLGDNRDNSKDSRYWGYVAEKNIIGKALIIWMNTNLNGYNVKWNRIFKYIK
ncbi:MAG: signal peptidase I [Enterobacteriaceae bacterium]|nr:signal peptidase I [Enterobacteriaceae bacterium]